jgi:hypothetical protein
MRWGVADSMVLGWPDGNFVGLFARKLGSRRLRRQMLRRFAFTATPTVRTARLVRPPVGRARIGRLPMEVGQWAAVKEGQGRARSSKFPSLGRRRRRLFALPRAKGCAFLSGQPTTIESATYFHIRANASARQRKFSRSGYFALAFWARATGRRGGFGFGRLGLGGSSLWLWIPGGGGRWGGWLGWV